MIDRIYTANGKEVLMNNVHFADCCTYEEAERAAKALNFDEQAQGRLDAIDHKLAGLEQAQTPEGHHVVPFHPTEAQWGGLARALMFAFDMNKHPAGIVTHLQRTGQEIPEWLMKELGGNSESKHTLSKGTRCVLIYKAMIHDLEKT